MSHLELVQETIHPERRLTLKASIDTPNQQEEARRIAEKIVEAIPGSAYIVFNIQIEQIYELQDSNEDIIKKINKLITEIKEQLKEIIDMEYSREKDSTIHFSSSSHSLKIRLEYNKDDNSEKRAHKCTIHGIIDIEPIVDSGMGIEMEYYFSTLEPGFIRKKITDLLPKA